ncbi:MAG: ATP-binding protein [Planctomycetaceae bacterium]
MSLATRLSIFFLAILAVVLIGFSSALYLFQRWALLRQADERMTTALKALVASIEVEPDGVEWNPLEHRLGGFTGDFRWRVLEDAGGVIDEGPGFPQVPAAGPMDFTAVEPTGSGASETWWISSERVEVPADAPPVDEAPAADGPDGDDIPEYPALTVMVAMPTVEVEAELNRLAVTLAVLSVIVWGGASIFGRTLVRRALRPMATMAAAARTMTAGSEARLPVSAGGDEVAELGDAFNKLLDRLGAAFERERRFTAEASHQLRTPVTALLGQIDVTLRRDRTAADYRESLQSARDQADRLRRIVESLLALARADAGASLRPPAPLELGAWLSEYAQTWTGRTGAAELRLDVRRNAVVAVEPEHLGQVLDVLIENALKYAPPATPVVLRSSEDGGRVAIDVIDAGAGVSDGEAADIFRPFHRGADAIRRGVPGLGLGLALAARIADRIGAELSFDRPAETGCRFRVIFRRSGVSST